MNSDVKVCDIVISTDVLAHDLDPHFLADYPPYCAVFKADEMLIEKADLEESTVDDVLRILKAEFEDE